VLSDARNSVGLTSVTAAYGYYPFGMMMPGRKVDNGYRFGFNGKEKDDEIKGSGNSYDYGMRIYDPRIGRFLSVDPLTKEYPWNSVYAYAENDVIRSIDLDGLEKLIITAKQVDEVGGTKIDVAKHDVIAYELSFSIEQPDGTIQKIQMKEPVIMFEAKSQQEGKNYSIDFKLVDKSPNAFKEGKTYELTWINYKGDVSLKPASGSEISPRVVIHPSSGTGWLAGCKSFCYQDKSMIGADGNLYTVPAIGTQGKEGTKEVFQELKDVYDKNKATSIELVVDRGNLNLDDQNMTPSNTSGSGTSNDSTNVTEEW
jgi:RHS repeat-associated protein